VPLTDAERESHSPSRSLLDAPTTALNPPQIGPGP
jgi:hypothetical protein